MVAVCTPTCKERSSTCHGTCEKYAEWRKKYEKEKEKERKEKRRFAYEQRGQK